MEVKSILMRITIKLLYTFEEQTLILPYKTFLDGNETFPKIFKSKYNLKSDAEELSIHNRALLFVHNKM